MHNYNELGIDLDYVPDYKLLMYYFNLKNAFPDKQIDVYRTKNGYHLIVTGVPTDLELRRIFGDDMWRIEFEEERSRVFRRTKDVLYHRKVVVRDGKIIRDTTREKVDILSLRFKNSRVRNKIT